MNYNRIQLLCRFGNLNLKLLRHSSRYTESCNISLSKWTMSNKIKYQSYSNLFIFKSYCSCKDSSTETNLIKSNSDSPSVDKTNIPLSGMGKYKLFEDFDSPVILDIEEERQLRLTNPEAFQEVTEFDEFSGINLKRGVTGVYDIEDLVDILRHDGAQNIVVLKIPASFKYVDYMVIVNGKSYRHMLALAEFIKKLYKRKKHESDYFPVIEGKESKDWIAMDLGNIALHFFSSDAREKYDIESLWALGPEYDDLTNQKEDEYIALLQLHTTNVADLYPLDSESSVKE